MGGNKGDSESTVIELFKNICEKNSSWGAHKLSFRLDYITNLLIQFLILSK